MIYSNLFLGFALIIPHIVFSQYSYVATTTGTEIVWTVPTNTCITAYTFEAWGAGANGLVAGTHGAAGGGAGGYARVTVISNPNNGETMNAIITSEADKAYNITVYNVIGQHVFI